ncbi:MAG TPA: DUF5666 domain-containing protein [Chloroflexota bacterium]
MRRLLGVLALSCLLAPSLPALAAPMHARHKSGPVTIRGVAHHVHAHDFVLQTASHGSYTVSTLAPTQIVEKGRSGKLTVAEGDHVGVRGIVQGTQIRAIQVRIYPVKPKPYSLKGVVRSVHGGQVTVSVGSRSYTVTVTGSTTIQTSSGPGLASDLRAGDRVDVRVQASGHTLMALHIHLYRPRTVARHVQLRGTITAARSGAITVVASGRPYVVGLTNTTRFYQPSSTSARSLRTGLDVTVYACCAGQPLVATSIHIHVHKVAVATVDVRGRVLALSGTSLRLDAQRGVLIGLSAATTYELGATHATRSSIRVGDHVSVRARRSGSALVATRVHVYTSYRLPHTVKGTVKVVSSRGLTVTARATVYTVVTDWLTVTRLAGKPIHITQLRVGDRVQAVGLLDGHQLHASTLDATRPAPKVREVRGVVARIGSGWLVVSSSTGKSYTIRVTSSTHLTWSGKQVSLGALFPGVHVTARGTLAGTTVSAATVTVTATTRSETGRVVGISRYALTLRRTSGTTVHVDLPSGVAATDGANRVSAGSVRPGAYARVTGYLETSGALRATSVNILHPTVDLHGRLTISGGTGTLQTSRGEKYGIRFASSAQITASRLDVSLHAADIPQGAEAQVRGSIGTDGAVLATAVVVRLLSVTMRARVTTIDAKGMTLPNGTGAERVRFITITTFAQGSRSLVISDIVAGDDVTAYGYGLAANTILCRKVLVHRRLLAVDGAVASVSGQSFVFTAADGPHTVLVSESTVVSGPAGTVLAAGMRVHVTGYLRGDGVILATRVKITGSS